MPGLTQEGGAGDLGGEHAGLALDAELVGEPALACHEPHHRLRQMDVEIVADDIPANVAGGALEQAAQKARKILFSAGIAEHAFDLAGGHVEGRNQGLRAVAAIFELTPLDLARRHRQSRRDALQRLDAGHLVDADGAMRVVLDGGGLVDRADVGALGIEGGIGLRGQPIAHAMRLEVGLFFKKRPTERCEMLGIRPRRMASSAISRWLQWLIGRSLADGFSQVIATRAQICSGVNTAGAPERGASARRSGTDCPSAAVRHRVRQYRTVLGQMPSSRALARTPTPSAACRMRRPRRASCCGVEWIRTRRSSAVRCSGKTVTGSAARSGMVTSCSSPGFVLAQHSRFHSSNLSAKTGVKTSARMY